MPKAPSSEQARRLLLLIGLLQPQTEIPLADLAGALGVSVPQVTADLELLSMCGVAPYSPGDLVPLYIEGDTVFVYGAMPALDRRVRLSPAEAQALAAALQAAGRTADDPLVSRLLDAASDADPHDIERVIRTAAATDPGNHATLSLAAGQHEAVRIRYQTGGTEKVTERVIEPLALLNERGTWYVEAYCRMAGAVRTFRVDRVRDAEPTGEHFEARTVILPGTALPTAGLPRALVRFEAGVEVPEREWPGMRVISEEPSGTVVEVPYAGTGWISRQVASFLGAAEVLEPAEVRRAVAELAASER
ncbi:MAG: WYL domain-containing protein [Coriobacteriia bacterium]|nr:WYL domain-containing protein [Coriobacteriia bacterium]